VCANRTGEVLAGFYLPHGIHLIKFIEHRGIILTAIVTILRETRNYLDTFEKKMTNL